MSGLPSMSGLPRTSSLNTAGVCTGKWAGHTPDDDRHCVCWMDAPADKPTPCCQCGQAPECVTCLDRGVMTVADGGPDRDGNYDTAEIPCPMCTDTWADRDDFEQSLADHHREIENEQ